MKHGGYRRALLHFARWVGIGYLLLGLVGLVVMTYFLAFDRLEITAYLWGVTVALIGVAMGTGVWWAATSCLAASNDSRGLQGVIPSLFLGDEERLWEAGKRRRYILCRCIKWGGFIHAASWVSVLGFMVFGQISDNPGQPSSAVWVDVLACCGILIGLCVGWIGILCERAAKTDEGFWRFIRKSCFGQ